MGKKNISSRATISDVGKRAKVSAQTVSRYLHEPTKVSPPTRDRIESAIKILKYIPNFKAQALATGEQNVIGVLIPSFRNVIFTEFLRGVHEAVEGTKYMVQIGNTRYSNEEEERLISLFAGQRPAGLILTGEDQSEGTKSILDNLQTHIVQIADISVSPIDMAVGFAYNDAVVEVVNHLHDQGYRKLGFISGQMDSRVMNRYESYKKHKERIGLADSERVVLCSERSSVMLGRKLLAKLIHEFPDTDSVFCGNDELALGAMNECQSRGLSVPEDIGIVGFHDLEMMKANVPSITSVDTNLHETGLKTASCILNRLKGVSEKPIHDMGFKLNIRDSTFRGVS